MVSFLFRSLLLLFVAVSSEKLWSRSSVIGRGAMMTTMTLSQNDEYRAVLD